MNLQELIPNFITEDGQFECKARLDRTNLLGWLKTVDGFANAKGGVIYLGVKDKSFDVVGYEAQDIDGEKQFFFHALKEHFPYMPSIKVSALPYEKNDKTRYLILIEVPSCEVKPVILKYQGMPMIYMRRDGFTNEATVEELFEMSHSSSSWPFFDKQITDIKYRKEDFSSLFAFYEERQSKTLTDKRLAAISFFNEDGYLAKGAYLFSDHYEGKETKIVCSSYRGFTRGDDVVVASNAFSGNLVDAYRFAYEFVNLRMNHGFRKVEQGRIDIDAYPSRALFEAIINALAHRDYYLEGSQISIDMFPNRLTISSPGSLFHGEEVKPTYDLDSLISRRRNELISNIFVLCGAMEAKGTGLEKIKNAYKDADISHRPYLFSKNGQFTIVLPDLTYEEGVSINEESIVLSRKIENGTRFDLDILVYCEASPRSVKEIAAYLGISDSSFLRKEVIQNLVDQGFLIAKEGKGKTYLSNKSLIILR